MRLLFLSHCTPNPPDKGEKIPAHHILKRLCRDHEVHLVCFARHPSELEAARGLEPFCASVFAHYLAPTRALASSALPFCAGGCLNMLYFRSAAVRRRVAGLAAARSFDAAFVFSLVMAPFVPQGLPFILDMQDVDSEKWLMYAACRRPSFLYRVEAARLRQAELQYARLATRTLLCTCKEEQLFSSFAANLPTATRENGMDVDYYHPARFQPLPSLAGRRFLLFLGSMDYYPNADAALHFATNIFPEIHRADPSLELFLVGRNPSPQLLALNRQPGITVTGTVPDQRPYLRDAQAVIAPLRLARGIQVKVLEALASGKPALVSSAVARSFGDKLPHGVIVCDSPQQYHAGLREGLTLQPTDIREATRQRFNWDRGMAVISAELDAIAASRGG